MNDGTEFTQRVAAKFSTSFDSAGLPNRFALFSELLKKMREENFRKEHGGSFEQPTNKN